MEIRETELPGIGQKFEAYTRNGEKVVIVIHDDGRREMYHYDFDDLDESISNVTFEDAEARQIAGILGGMVYKPKALESIEIALDDLVIEWFKVREHAELAGKTLGDIDLRKDYGVNIIAVMNKNNKKELNPGPRTTIDSGDTIVISGQRNGVKRFIKDLLSSKEELM